MDEVAQIPRRLLLAIGGNAIQPAGARGTSEEQVSVAAITARSLLPILALDNELVITHGNGPAVGKVLMRQPWRSPRSSRCRSTSALPTPRARPRTFSAGVRERAARGGGSVGVGGPRDPSRGRR